MLLCALLLAIATPALPAEESRLQALEQRLARTPPVSTDFVEYRFSRLLRKPLRSSGTLEYRADGVLVRNVAEPRREVTEVDDEQLRVARAGKPPRTMPLQRAPQLRVLLGSFRALLEGRLTPLRQDFDVTLQEDATQWTLRLVPRDAGLARQLARIEVHGSGDRPGCLAALEPDGDGAFTLFTHVPAGAKPPTRAEAEHACSAPAAQGMK